MSDREVLDEIWACLQVPCEWDSETIEIVAAILARHGWKQIPQEEIRPMEELEVESLAEAARRWPRYTQRLIDKYTPAREGT